MVYGPLSARKGLPEQNWNTILLIADRFDRASQAQNKWAVKAKECVDFVEGKQWTDEDLKEMAADDRPALVFNKINALLRLVMGYFMNNRTDEKFLPGQDDIATDQVAQAITKVAKQMSESSKQPYVDGEVFVDGIITGRGYYDCRMKFEKNDLGEYGTMAQDPFATYLDPDGDQYDLNESSFVMTSKWFSLNQIAETYGESAKLLVEPLLTGGVYTGLPASITDYAEELTPFRKFGGELDGYLYSSYGPLGSFLHNQIDDARRSIRVLEMQHYTHTMTRMVVDLETGTKKFLPEHWDMERIYRFLAWTDEKFAAIGQKNPLRYDERVERRVRWTTMVGDFLVWDDWSPYDSFTIIPFFPWFRRGKTRGMVEDLIDPQREINKRRSAQIDQVSRTANSGWIWHKEGMDHEEQDNWERNSAVPGFTGSWSGKESWMKPEKITQAAMPLAAERLEDKAAGDLKEISGINEALMGQTDKVQSGRALEAKQRQGVVSIQTYMTNMTRTKELVGIKKLSLIQNHMTEQRLIRVLAADGSQEQLIINQRGTAGEIIRNVTLGTYGLSIDETPLSASYNAAQFEELMEMIEKGVLPVELVMDIAVDTSSIPSKELIKQRIQDFMAAKGIQVDGPATGAAPAEAGLETQSLVQDGRGNVVPLAPTPAMQGA